MQLVELQSIASALEAEQVALYAVSYDAVSTLAGFAERHGITYPLLSDEGGETIARLGLRDDDLEAHHAVYNAKVEPHMHGVAFPGVFVLDRDGIVVDKRSSDSYRERDTATTLLEEALGIAAPSHGPVAHAPGDVVEVQMSVDSPRWWWWQRLRLVIDVRIRPGWHVYGAGAPSSYIPLQVELEDPRGLTVGEADLAKPRPAAVAGETVPVHEGEVRVVLPVTVRRPPGTGDLELSAKVRYQACSDTECLPPAETVVSVAVPEADAVS